MSLRYFEVCGVMGRSYLQGSSAERSIDSIISDYGDFLAYNGESDNLAYELL